MSSPRSFGLGLQKHPHSTSQRPSSAARGGIRAHNNLFMTATDSRSPSPAVIGDIRAQYIPSMTVANSQIPSSTVVGNVLAQNTLSVAVTDPDAMSLPYEDTSARDDDTGSHRESSIVWLSDEEKLREAFINAYRNAIRMGFQDSPFFPQSVVEWAKACTAAIEMRTKSLTEKIRQSQEVAEQQKKSQAALEREERLAVDPMLSEDPRLLNELLDLPIPQQPVKPVFHIKQGVGQDGLSTVLALDNCTGFNNPSLCDAKPQNDDWPSAAAFKMYRGTNTFPPPQSWFHGY